jgi:hypothetical protein
MAWPTKVPEFAPPIVAGRPSHSVISLIRPGLGPERFSRTQPRGWSIPRWFGWWPCRSDCRYGEIRGRGAVGLIPLENQGNAVTGSFRVDRDSLHQAAAEALGIHK